MDELDGNARYIVPATNVSQPGHRQAGIQAINKQLTDEETRALAQQLEELRLEHRDLDDVIHHLTHSDYPDQLQIKRLKKRKLRLKDSIQLIESRLIPDIDA